MPEEVLPDSDTDSLFILYAVLCLTKGSTVSNQDVHDAWSAWMTLRGEQHESLVPYDQLPARRAGRGQPLHAGNPASSYPSRQVGHSWFLRDLGNPGSFKLLTERAGSGISGAGPRWYPEGDDAPNWVLSRLTPEH